MINNPLWNILDIDFQRVKILNSVSSPIITNKKIVECKFLFCLIA